MSFRRQEFTGWPSRSIGPDAYRAWVIATAEKHHRKSMRSGERRDIAPRLRIQVYDRDGWVCRICGDWYPLTLDHIIPQSLGGPSTIDNLQTLCNSCNARKGARQS